MLRECVRGLHAGGDPRGPTPETVRIDREFFGPASLEARKIHWSMAKSICRLFSYSIHPSELGCNSVEAAATSSSWGAAPFGFRPWTRRPAARHGHHLQARRSRPAAGVDRQTRVAGGVDVSSPSRYVD